MKKVHTTVSTGDTFTMNDLVHTVGNQRRIDGKLVIDIHVRLNQTSGYTIQVSTRKLNQILKSI